MTADGVATATINRRQAALSSFYRWAARPDIGAITDGRPNPFNPDLITRIRPSSRHTTALDSKQVSALLDAARSGPHPDRDWLLVMIMATTGLRVSEMCAATHGDIARGPTGHELATEGKGRKVRMVPLAPAIIDAIPAGRTGPLVPDNRGGHLNRHQVKRILFRLAARAGIGTLSPHMLRATVVTELLDAGMELGAVQDLAGHSDPRTTRGYQTRRHAAATRARMAATLYARYTEE